MKEFSQKKTLFQFRIVRNFLTVPILNMAEKEADEKTKRKTTEACFCLFLYQERIMKKVALCLIPKISEG